ncbi:lipoyl synthase, partial [Clostridium sp. cpc1]|nr:lipoyl synthase [Clostridium sp. cpc1]
GLYKKVRPEAIYTRSLELLRKVKEIDKNILTKSGFMVGLGEKEEEVIELLKDLRKYQCDIVTIGQYLQPSKEHIELEEYVHPEVFKKYKKIGLDMGFKYIASSPLVRSSYNAAEALK